MNTFFLAMTSNEMREIFINWCKERNYSHNSLFPPKTPEVDVKRLKKRIKEKKKQLPFDKLGMILIHCENMLFVEKEDIEKKFISNFDSFLKDDQNLIALAFIGGPYYFGEEKNIIQLDRHYFIKSSDSILGG